MKKIAAFSLAVLLLSLLCIPASALKPVDYQKVNTYHEQFTDVPATSWCAESVKTVYEYGIMGGVSDTSFNPNGTLSTAAAIATACRLHDLYFGMNCDFTLDGFWFTGYEAYAVKAGIIPRKGAYDYDAPVTRAVFAQLISNALLTVELPKINDIGYGAIPDVISTQPPLYAAILALEDAGVLSVVDGYEMSMLAVLGGGSHFAQEIVSPPADGGNESYESIYRLYQAGILTGNDAYGTFTPNASITRASAAAILSRMVEPSLRKQITLQKNPAALVSVDQLANCASLQKKLSKSELTQAYEAAKKIVEPLANLSREAQLSGIMVALRAITNNEITYSSSAPHYSDAYGFFILHTASCAGCTRATGLCLNMLGIPYEHVNENQYSHQWTRVNLNGTYWICDAYGLYCGPEEAPYQHPNV